MDGDFFKNAGAWLAPACDGQRAIRPAVLTWGPANVGSLIWRRGPSAERLQGLSIDCQAPTGEDPRVLIKNAVRMMGEDVPVLERNAEGGAFHERYGSRSRRPGRIV